MISPAIYKGDDVVDCPEGPAYTIKEEYLAAQSPAERARLMQEENADELEELRRAYSFDEQGRSICVDPEAFDRPPQRQGNSKIAIGLNLDGRDGSGPLRPLVIRSVG